MANKTPAATASAAEASATIKKPIVGDDLFSVDGVGAVGVSAFLPVVADVASFNKEPLTQLPPIPSSSSGNSSVVDDLQRRKAAESAPVSADAIAKGLQTLFSGLTANAPAEMFSLYGVTRQFAMLSMRSDVAKRVKTKYAVDLELGPPSDYY